MKLKITKVDGSTLTFDLVERLTIKDGMVLIWGYIEKEEKSYENIELFERIKRIHSFEGEE